MTMRCSPAGTDCRDGRLCAVLGRIRGQFLLIDQVYGILGRNVLNAISLTMDGPKRQWRET